MVAVSACAAHGLVIALDLCADRHGPQIWTKDLVPEGSPQQPDGASERLGHEFKILLSSRREPQFDKALR